MASSMNVTVEELNTYKIKELQDFIRTYKPSINVTGSKPELLKRAILIQENYQNEIDKEIELEVESSTSDLSKKRKIFEKSTLKWQSYKNLKRSLIPQTFDDIVISNFLTNLNVVMDDTMEQTGTKKPARKGKEMYKSRKVQLVEFALDQKYILFRSNIIASYSVNEIR